MLFHPLRVLACLVVLLIHNPDAVYAQESPIQLGLSADLSKSICFVAAFSSNHFQSGLRFIVTAQTYYPCNRVYVYDLGLTASERKSLHSFPFIRMLSLNMTKPYFPNGACAFKPIMMLDFITRFHSNDDDNSHDCRYFFYGDASVLVHTPFDQLALDEVHRLGLVAQKPIKNRPQISFTHPKMYPFFGFNRTLMYEEGYLYPRAKKHVLKQVQAGLLFVDASNTTMRDTFFSEWAACAHNYDCLIPDNIVIDKSSKHFLSTKYTVEEYGGVKIFKAHRDDQSAFTFLIGKYFGYASTSIRKVFLEQYTWVLHKQWSTIPLLQNATKEYSCMKDKQGDMN